VARRHQRHECLTAERMEGFQRKVIVVVGQCCHPPEGALLAKGGRRLEQVRAQGSDLGEGKAAVVVGDQSVSIWTRPMAVGAELEGLAVESGRFEETAMVCWAVTARHPVKAAAIEVAGLLIRAAAKEAGGADGLAMQQQEEAPTEAMVEAPMEVMLATDPNVVVENSRRQDLEVDRRVEEERGGLRRAKGQLGPKAVMASSAALLAMPPPVLVLTTARAHRVMKLELLESEAKRPY